MKRAAVPSILVAVVLTLGVTAEAQQVQKSHGSVSYGPDHLLIPMLMPFDKVCATSATSSHKTIAIEVPMGGGQVGATPSSRRRADPTQS